MADSTPYASNPVNECNEKKRLINIECCKFVEIIYRGYGMSARCLRDIWNKLQILPLNQQDARNNILLVTQPILINYKANGNAIDKLYALLKCRYRHLMARPMEELTMNFAEISFARCMWIDLRFGWLV
ncbi:hypothetical protein GQR58_017609 [Nymphon striatum]|nr:hypothetical protein GQR58_017609 [Nymphon striatum]